MHLVFGIGNPGPKYALTRHNLGFMVVDLLAMDAGQKFRRLPGLRAEAAAVRIAGRKVLLVKPLTYVNRCGGVLAALCSDRGIPFENLLVVVDDLDLPPGRLRLRPSGSDGGHNGLRSIRERLGTGEFPRLRIGIGSAGGRPAEEFVLEPVPEADRPVIREALDRAVVAVATWLESGIDEAMALVNRRDLDQPPDPA